MLYRNFETQAQLDAEYSPQKAGIDSSAYMDWYITNSTKVRSELSCQLNVPFGYTRAEHLDIFPAPQPEAPIMVFIHGGYWMMASSKEFSFVAKGMVSAGITTVVVNYALCPKVTIDEIVRQTRGAIAWVYQNAKSFGGDPNRIYVSGHSAGGHLTAMSMITKWESDYGLPSNIIKAGCAISGLFDLMPFPYTWLQPKIQLTWGEVLRNSPIQHIPQIAGSLIVTYGEKETSEFHRRSQDFLNAWLNKSLQGEFLIKLCNIHFFAIDCFLNSDSLLCKAILTHMGTVNLRNNPS